jgi:hypothetical protein
VRAIRPNTDEVSRVSLHGLEGYHHEEISPRVIGVSVNRRAFEPHLDCVPSVNVAYDPTRFKHDPSHGMRGVGKSAFRDFHTAHKDKHVLVIVLVKFTNGLVVAHGSRTLDSSWSVGIASIGGADLEILRRDVTSREPSIQVAKGS